MSKTNSLKPFALAGALSAMFLASCALPPREAWQRIQEDGLVTYLTGNSKESPSEFSGSAAPEINPSVNRQAPAPVLITTGARKNQPSAPGTEPAIGNEPLKVLAAQSVPSLPGFVRSPYTNPPRLVDVKGSSPGTTMVCPYTQRPFTVPTDFQNPVGAIASAPPVKSQPSTAQNGTRAPQPAIGIVTPQTPATVAFNNTAAPKTQPTATASNPATTPKNGSATANVASDKPALLDVPVGTLIQGRPGFVNSPFAAKHQLVDVTGLPAGMEVKCPYTGKLFRVPAQEMVSSKVEDQSKTQILSSPDAEKKDKK